MVPGRRHREPLNRIRILTGFAGVFIVLIVVRLFSLQVLSHGFYKALAEGQHSLYEKLFPKRGKIYATERGTDQLFPLATNEPLQLVFANPSKLKDDPRSVAEALSPVLDVDAQVLEDRLRQKDHQYVPLKHEVNEDVAERVRELGFDGIEFSDELTRFYPEGKYGSHIIGFLGYDGDLRKGQYGIEGSYDKELAGTVGQLEAKRGAGGAWIAMGGGEIRPAQDGDDVVLTIDRTIQYEACSKLDEEVKKHGADGGSVVVLDPSTGAILAMCGNPDFDPNNYSDTKDPSDFLNPAIFKQYEPGSVMKGITMASAIDLGKVTPNTTYTDEGFVKIGGYTIKNSDGMVHGVNTMTQVLEQSLNTGAIFAVRQIGIKSFDAYLEKFGFGKKTGIELQGEQPGDLSSLKTGKEIYAATASYGQGVTVTPLQLALAYAAIANRGVLMEPSIVKEVRKPDGTKIVKQPTEVRQVVSPETATTVTAMLVNVVKNGHGKRAGVPGYYIAGKTGTAQVPRKDGPGYEPNMNIGSFAGFGPVEKPVFTMVVRIDHPRDVMFAESTAAPLFGELADFILRYLEVPQTADVPSP